METNNGNCERLLSSVDNNSFTDSIIYSKIDLDHVIPGDCRKQKDFDDLYIYTDYHKSSIIEKLRDRLVLKPLNVLLSLFPILRWLPQYKWHTDLFHDVVSGMTVAIIHIPQGLAYSILAGVPPIVGIYMAFFPVLVYVVMGTSRHISMGTFAVICMMAGKSVAAYATVEDDMSYVRNNSTISNIPAGEAGYSPIQVVAALSLVVGTWQILLGLLRLGSLSVILSEHLISGLVTGAAILVIVSQVKHMFGLRLGKHIGTMKVFFTLADVVQQFSSINYVALAITTCVFSILMIYNELLKSHISRRLPFPVPTELIMIISGTLLSKYVGISSTYNLTTVGNIPTGLPKPYPPPVSLFPKLILDGLVIAIVSFSVNISMASIFAEKHKYRVDANQELVASGCSNIFGSFFSCAPFSASLSRSLIQESTGGRTQLASIVSSVSLIFVLLFIGPFFEPLPHCVLTGIILAAMKGMLLNVKDLTVAWKQSKPDGCIWMVTFVSVIFIDIDFGLCIGVMFSLLYITLLGQKVKVIPLGNIPNTDIYIHVKNYQAAVHIPGILVLHVVAGINFANKESVRRSIYKRLTQHQVSKISHVILDMSSVSYIDPSSVKCLLRIHNELRNRNITLSLSKCSPDVLKVFMKCRFFDSFPETQLFPSVHDAVMHVKCYSK